MVKRLPWPEGTGLSLGAGAGPPDGRAGLAAGGEGALGSFTGQKPWQWGSRREGGGQASSGFPSKALGFSKFTYLTQLHDSSLGTLFVGGIASQT